MKNCYDCNHCEVCRWINEYKDKDVCDFYDQGQNQEPKKSCNIMDFPNTFDEFAKDYGFKDSKEVYTNGSDLIQVFRVKQWLEHIESQESKKIYCNHIDAEIAKSFIEDVEAVKDLLPKAESEDNCNTCIHYKPDNPYCECCFNLDKYEKEKQE